MPQTKSTVHIIDKTFELLISQEDIQQRIETVAKKVCEDYKDRNPLFIGVLNGSFIFCADLVRQIDVPSEVSFIRVASYEGTQSSGDIKQILGLSDNVFRRDVIIVEDIIDSGKTMESILNHFEERGAQSVEICSLLVKPNSLTCEIDIKYRCFDISDEFVVGYGLDYDGQGRNLKEIYQLAPK
jgi:hypoxanthine phosphoribosyltransferase